MDEQLAREVLAKLSGTDLVLWRTASVHGGDIDLLVPAGEEGALATAGLEPAGDGHWKAAGGRVVADPFAVADWPRHYPVVDGVLRRAHRINPAAPRVAAPEDRLRILAADAVAGRPVEKLAWKMREALGDLAGPPAGDDPLMKLARDPDALEAAAGRAGALPMRRALAVAMRAPRARWALVVRLRGRLGR